MAESTETQTRVIHPRIPAPLHGQISEYARETHRTLNGAVVALLEQAIQDHNLQRGDPNASGLHHR